MVSKTKTGHKHPVVLDFDSHLKGAMSFFFKHIRHQFARTDSGNLFFTFIHGNALCSSYIGTLMRRSFQKAIGARANPTRVRKMTSTMVAFESDQVKKQTAASMTHTSATQEKSYTHITLIENNAKVARLLANRRKKEAKKIQEEVKEDEKEKEESEMKDEEIIEPTETSATRFQFTTAEEELLSNEFTDVFSSGKFPSRPSVRTRIANSEELKDLACKMDGESSISFPRLVQKVINMWRKLHKKH